MKVLHLITRLILGGAQENTVLSVRGQVEAGHDVTLAFGPIYGPEGSLLDQARATGARLVELPAMRRAVHPWRDWVCQRQCRRLIREVQPDVVHTHSSKAGVVGRKAAWALGVPAVVHTLHGLAYHPYQAGWKNRLYIAAEKRAVDRCHKIVCVADAMTRQALDAGIGTAEKYTTVYSGMEVEPYTQGPDDRAATRAELGIAEGDLVVGTVARLAELKGHDDIMDGLPQLVAAHPELKLLWVGDGWWRARHEKRLAAMGMRDRVIMTGLVPPERVAVLMRAMDVLVHPSYREGLPRTVPQALLSGVPVVAYDCDGAGEACIDGETGLLAATGDIDALRRAIAWMTDHPAERREMAERGRELCIERFDWRQMVSQLEGVYRQVLRASR